MDDGWWKVDDGLWAQDWWINGFMDRWENILGLIWFDLV
jgi:hypothetical protein